jgi:hypothetical protein
LTLAVVNVTITDIKRQDDAECIKEYNAFADGNINVAEIDSAIICRDKARTRREVPDF